MVAWIDMAMANSFQLAHIVTLDTQHTTHNTQHTTLYVDALHDLSLKILY